MNRRRTANSARRLFTMVALVALLLSAAAPAYAGGAWTNLTRVTPTARDYHAMASLGEDQVLLFGGYDGAFIGETWIYDLSANTWTSQAPAAAPSARVRHAMVSVGADRVLLFGGFDGTTTSGDTWLATGFYSGIWYRTYLPVVVRNY